MDVWLERSLLLQLLRSSVINLLVRNRFDRQCRHHSWHGVTGQSPGEVVGDLTHHVLDEAHVVELLVECLEPVDFTTVEVLATSPALLDSHSGQVRSRSYVPDGFNVNICTGHQLLDNLRPVVGCVVPHHSQSNSIANLGANLFERITNVFLLEAAFAIVPGHYAKGGRNNAEHHHRLLTHPARALLDRLAHLSPVYLLKSIRRKDRFIRLQQLVALGQQLFHPLLQLLDVEHLPLLTGQLLSAKSGRHLLLSDAFFSVEPPELMHFELRIKLEVEGLSSRLE